MPKVNNIVSTAHAQQKELTALVGSASGALATQKAEEYETALVAANEQIDSLTAELEAEKAAHAATKAALDAAVAAPVTTSGA